MCVCCRWILITYIFVLTALPILPDVNINTSYIVVAINTKDGPNG